MLVSIHMPKTAGTSFRGSLEEHFGEHFRHSSAGTRAEGARIDATLSDDPAHANAQDVLLESVEVET